MGDQVPASLALERLAECSEVQDAITSRSPRRAGGADSDGARRQSRQRPQRVHEAPEIDGIIAVPPELAVGEFHEVVITGSFGTDLMAMPR